MIVRHGRARTWGAVMGWLWALGFGCSDPAEAPQREPPGDGGARSVLVLVVDGARADEVCGLEVSPLTGEPGPETTPGLWGVLAPDALVARDQLVTGATITAPAHAALLVGQPEAYANFPTDGGAGLYRPTLPTLFEAAREQLGLDADEVALVGNTQLLEGLTGGAGSPWAAEWAFVTREDGAGDDDATVLDEVRRRIERGPPRLLVVNLHDVDRAGHNQPPEVYPARIAAVDAAIAELWTWIRTEQPAYADNLLLVVTTDHGRHRLDAEEAWRNHGDGCFGCRETPLFLLGPDVTPGEIAAPHALDLTPTIAAHLGIEMPWAWGLPLEGFEGVARTGEVAITANGALVATQRFRDDASARSEIVVNDVVRSTAGALAAEGPSVLDAPFGAVACWRELAETTDGLPWSPRCVVDGVDIGFPGPEVGPFSAFALAEHDGALVLAWADNPTAAGEGESYLALATWRGDEGWSGPTRVEASFPTDPALVGGEVLVAAVATNLDEDRRHTRRVRIVAGDVVTDLAEDGARLERPALAADGANVRLAALRTTATGTDVVTAASADGGRTWSALAPLPGHASGHVAPAWDGEDVVWVAGDHLCRAAPGDAEASCVAAGSPRVQSFVVREGGAVVVRDEGVAAWARAELDW